MKVDTPVATMGIRGTACLVEIEFDLSQVQPGLTPLLAPPVRFQVLVEPDGTSGSYVLLDRATLAPMATVSQPGTVTSVSGSGAISFLTSAQLSPEVMKLISEVFSQKYSDNTNPKSDTHFTDTVVPDNTFTVKLANGDSFIGLIHVVTVAEGAPPPPSTAPGTSGHIPGPPTVFAQNNSLSELQQLTGSSLVDNKSGSISYEDVNAGDTPTARTAFKSFTYHDAEHQDVTGTLTATQLAAIANVSVPLNVVQDSSQRNIGTATWSYNVPDGALDFLAVGETLTLTYTAFVDNNFGPNNETGSATFTITITGTNDAPTIVVNQTAATGGVVEDSNVNAAGEITASGAVTFSDVDLTDTHTATVVPESSTSSVHLPGFTDNTTYIGTFTLVPVSEDNDDGTNNGSVGWTFTLDDDNPILHSLEEGQTITQVYLITVSDGHGGTVTQEITITITGHDSPNHAPTIVGELTTATGAVTEDTNVSESHEIAAVGTIVFSDVDLFDAHTASFTETSSTSAAHLPGFIDNTTYIGTFELTPVNEDLTDTNSLGSFGWTFTLDDLDPTLQSLAVNQTITQVYTVLISDGHGGTVTQDVTVTINGINDTPLITSDAQTGAIAERADTRNSSTPDTASGTVTFTDVDLIDTHSVTITGVSAGGTTSGLADHDTLLGWLSLGALSDSTGGDTGSRSWSFSAQDHYFDYLADDEQLTLTYTIQVDDHHGGVVTQDVVITVTGTNDAPVITSDDQTGAITERADTRNSSTPDKASGTVTFTDVDLSDTHSVTITGVSASGTTSGLADHDTLLGWLSLGALTDSTGGDTGSGTWSFSAADRNFDYLAAGEQLTLTYTIQVDDHHGGVVTQDVVITITGTNDAPVITSDDQNGAITELADARNSTAPDTASGAVTFTDLDLSDVHVTVKGVSATGTTSGLAANPAVLGWLSLGAFTDSTDGVTGAQDWSFSAQDRNFDYLAAGEQLTLTYTIEVDDHHGGVVTQDVVITVTGTNDTPVITSGAQTATIDELPATRGSHTPDTAHGTVTFTDLDLSDTHTVTVTGLTVSGATSGLPNNATISSWLSLGSLTDSTNGATGQQAWSFSAEDRYFDYLRQDQQLTLTYTVQIDDHHGGVTTQNVTITIDGTNDAPIIQSETDAPTDGVMVVNPLSPTIEPAGQNTNALGLANESFDGKTPGSVSDNGTGTGNFTSADLGATFTASGHAGIVHGSSSVSAAPFMGPLPGSQETSNYLSIGAGATETITFTTDKNTFGLYWGSVDSYNTIEFYEGDTLVASYTGADIAPLLATGNQGSFTANGYVEFAGLPNFNKVVLGTGASNAFEIDNISAGTGPVAHATLQGPLSGTLSVHDPDIGDTLTGVVSADATVLYNNSSTLPSGVNVADLIKAGNLTFDSVQSDGGTDTLHWNYDPHGANLDFLHAGDVLKITYTAQVSDGHGSYGSQQIAVTLVGTNSQTNVSALTVVDGTSGNDKFSNVGGNTTIFGNGGHDNFMFNPASGSATIADFDPSNDALTFASSMFNHNPANVLAAAHDDGHGNTVISLGGPDTITLQHVQASHLSASDFHFV
jgi:VCBS repeat-containing protein